MVFASILFLLFFFPLVTIGYFVVPPRGRNAWLIGSSFAFYAWGGGIRDMTLLLAVAAIDFVLAWRIWTGTHPRRYLVVSLVWNLALLSIFKYGTFLWINIGTALGAEHPGTLPPWLHLTLPLGISFFVFETLSYVIDVYRRAAPPAQRLSDYAMYLSLFPHLIAGPIYRFSDIRPDLDPVERSKRINASTIQQGLFFFALGLAKKCLVANPMARVADLAFHTPSLSVFEAWLGIVAYAFQIYFDFSGYSMMAIGMAKVYGFHFPRNFNVPYSAASITDFWHRWHMSLSHWFRDYLYIPLGGNRGGPWRTYRNLFAVFLLCGLWHGANWTFVVWGAFHGIFLCLERRGWSPLNLPLPASIARAVCFITVLIGWVFFRAETLTQAVAYVGKMFGAQSTAHSTIVFATVFESAYLPTIFAIGSLSLCRLPAWWTEFETAGRLAAIKCAVAALLLFWCTCELASGTFNPFIYFRF